MKKLIFLFLLTLVFNAGFTQNQESRKKIGLIFNISGPYDISRQTLINMVGSSDKIDQSNPYYEAIKFLGADKCNPTEKIENYYLESLKALNFEPTIIREKIENIDLPKFNMQGKKKFSLDLKYFKNKYDIDYIIMVGGIFGMEFENIGFISGDKRTHISLRNTFININTNEIKDKFDIGNIKNIKKKNLINPPDFPNVLESMERLLNERIFPEIKNKLVRYIQLD